MKSGSREIQKIMERQVPRQPGEYKKQWWIRVSRYYDCTTIKAENIYYREGHSIPNEIYLKLTELRTPAVTTAKPHDKRLEENAELREELKELKNYLRARDAKFKHALEALFN